jgi:PTH1 family peptidyl-tRNA hydrolase
METFLITGLGNPGEKYKNTRHNVGFEILDYLAEDVFGLEFSFNKKINAFLCDFVKDGKKYFFLKPATYMNNSGQAVSRIMSYYNISLENILVIQDDIDIDLGKVKISQNSGSAGHKGIISIMEELGSKNFKRLRVGIRIQNQEIPAERFVLQKMSKEELEKINSIKEDIFSLVEDFLKNKRA